VTERTFDWKPTHDPRSRAFRAAALLTHASPRSYTWRCEPRLDQGREGACVGFGIAHEIAARPREHIVSEALAQKIYRDARKIDEWPGEAYDGTSVLAGMKVATGLGYYTGYRWAFGLDEALAAISRHGPAVIGVWWHAGMTQPDADGMIRAVGSKVGGHCVLVNGVSVTKRLVRVHNSWGPSWGRDGAAYLTWDDFGRLLADDGECALPVRQ
jgi:hypothetical protein